jgi:drug/metabolite transporter (DMT)-like permease
MKNNKLAYFYALLCVVFWALIPTLSKYMLKELNNLQILFYSSIFSFITLFVLIILQGKFAKFKEYSFCDYFWMVMLGFLGSYLYYVLLYAAFNLTSAAEGYILAYTYPIIIVLLGWVLLKESLGFLKIFAIILSFIGVILVFTKGNITEFSFSNIYGNLLSLTAAFVFAFFSVLGKKHAYDANISAFIYWLTSFILISITMPFFSSFSLFSLNTFFLILLNGIVVNGITYIFWFKALELGDTAKVSNLVYLSPFMALIYIFFFLKEKIILSTIIGFIFIMLGIIIQSVQRRRKKD